MCNPLGIYAFIYICICCNRSFLWSVGPLHDKIFIIIHKWISQYRQSKKKRKSSVLNTMFTYISYSEQLRCVHHVVMRIRLFRPPPKFDQPTMVKHQKFQNRSARPYRNSNLIIGPTCSAYKSAPLPSQPLFELSLFLSAPSWFFPRLWVSVTLAF